MAAHAETRTHRAGNRRDEAAALFADAAGFEKAAVSAPAHQLDARFVAALDPGIEQLARLPFARGGTAMGQDDIERVVRAEIARHVHLLAQCLEIGLHRACRSACRAGRAIEARSDLAANAQGRVVDADRLAAERESAIVRSCHRQFEIETRPEAQLFERAGIACNGAAAEHDIDLRARFDLGERHGTADQRHDPLRIALPHAGAAQHAFETVSRSQSGHQFDTRTFGRGGQGAHQRGRAHAVAGIGPQSQRCDRLAAQFVALRLAQARGRCRLQRREIGPEGDCGTRQADKRAHAAQPAQAANPAAEIGRKVQRGKPRRKALSPAGRRAKRRF